MDTISDFDTFRDIVFSLRDECNKNKIPKTIYLDVDPSVVFNEFITNDFTNRNLNQEDRFEAKQPEQQELASDRHTLKYYIDYYIETLLGTRRYIYLAMLMEKVPHYHYSWGLVIDGQNRCDNDYRMHNGLSLRYWNSLNGIDFNAFKDGFKRYEARNPHSKNLTPFIELQKFVAFHKNKCVCNKDFTTSHRFPTLKENLKSPVHFKISVDKEENHVKMIKIENAKPFPHPDHTLFLMDTCGNDFYKICFDSVDSRNWSRTSDYSNGILNVGMKSKRSSNLYLCSQLANDIEDTNHNEDTWIKFRMLSTWMDIINNKVFSTDLLDFENLSILFEKDIKFQRDKDHKIIQQFISSFSNLSLSKKKKLKELNDFHQTFSNVCLEWSSSQKEYKTFLKSMKSIRNNINVINKKNKNNQNDKRSYFPTDLQLKNITPSVTVFEYVSKMWFTKYKSDVKDINEFLTDIISLYHKELISFINKNFDALTIKDSGKRICRKCIKFDVKGQFLVNRMVLDNTFKKYEQLYTKSTYSKAYPVEEIVDDLGLLLNGGYIFTDPLSNVDIVVGHNATSDHVISDKNGGNNKIENCVIMDKRFNSRKNKNGYVGDTPYSYYEMIDSKLEEGYNSGKLKITKQKYHHSKTNLAILMDFHGN